ncbi:MAG: hypothetical protein RBU45_13400 [Myxococcota bacterium]|mgnify:CR=1 FL=1|nr:hypothetical protein [Myxococcota bacterium]
MRRSWCLLPWLLVAGLAGCSPEPGAAAGWSSAAPEVVAAALESPRHARFPDQVLLPWGDAAGEVGLWPGAPERPPAGPDCLTWAHDGGVWLNDPHNGRVVHLGPDGSWQGSLATPPAVEGLLGLPDGGLLLLGLANRRLIRLSAKGEVLEERGLHPAFRTIAGLAWGADGELRLVTGYQETYSLGHPGSPRRWPELLRTRQEGVAGVSGGRPVQVVLTDSTGTLLWYERTSTLPGKRPEPTAVPLAGTAGAASLRVLDADHAGRSLLLEERHAGEQVARRLRVFDGEGRDAGSLVLPEVGLYLPRTEFAAGPEGVLLQLRPLPDGLVLARYTWPEVQP